MSEPMVDQSYLFFWGCLLVVDVAAGLIISVTISHVYNYIMSKAEHQFDLQLIDKSLELPFSFFDSSAGRDMLDGVKSLKYTAINFCLRLVYLLTVMYTFAVSFIFLASFNISFTLGFLALIIPSVILDAIFKKKAEDLWWQKMPDIRRMSYYRWMLTDAKPAKDIRTYNLTDHIKTRYQTEKKEYMSEKRSLQKRKTINIMVTDFIRYLGVAAFIFIVVVKAMNNELSVGDASMYTGYALSCSASFVSFLEIILVIYRYATKYMDTLFEFFNMKSEFFGGTENLNSFESLEFDNVSFKYPTGKKAVLTGVSFVLKRGEKLSIVGINGSGKTTIVKLMLGFYQADSGRILINGMPIEKYKISEVRKQFSALFQDFIQYPLELRYNVAFSDLGRSQNDGEIITVLKQSGIYDELESKLYNGLDSYMKRRFDDNGIELSKGQWQKLSLARVYYKNASVLIFDEPSASLDAEAEDRIFRNYEVISQGKTGIMISHRISAARGATNIIVLDGGKIAEQGTHDELVAAGGLYSELYKLQREKYVAQEDK
jgi:ABC-type multidrug transport system fused ATPase/permease subunit